MGEHVVVRQNYQFETEILAADPHTPESDQLESVAHVFQLTPYGMLLAGLGACTAVVLNTYAEYHGVGLEQVEPGNPAVDGDLEGDGGGVVGRGQDEAQDGPALEGDAGGLGVALGDGVGDDGAHSLT